MNYQNLISDSIAKVKEFYRIYSRRFIYEFIEKAENKLIPQLEKTRERLNRQFEQLFEKIDGAIANRSRVKPVPTYNLEEIISPLDYFGEEKIRERPTKESDWTDLPEVEYIGREKGIDVYRVR